MTAPERLSLTLQTSGDIKYITWKNGYSNGDIYQYDLNIATNNTVEDTGYQYTFNMFNTQPHAHPGSDYQLVAILNGGLYYMPINPTYSIGYEKSGGNSVFYDTMIGTSYMNTYQAFGMSADDHQLMTVGNHEYLYWSNYYSGLCGGTNSDGTVGEPGPRASSIHSFIGYCGDTSFMGYNNYPMSGTNLITAVKNIFGSDSKVIILDGGGSTQMWLRGSIVRPSSDSGGVRTIKNAICIYEHIGIKVPDNVERNTHVNQVRVNSSTNCYREKSTSSYLIGQASGLYNCISKDGDWYQLDDYAWVNSNTVTYYPAAELKTVIVTISGEGTVTGAGQYYEGDTCTLTATPAEHYTFTNWSGGVSTNPYSFTVTADTTITATFTEDTKYTIDGTCTHGTIVGTGDYYIGDEVVLACVGDPGYTLDHWTDGETANPRTIVVTGAATYNAIMKMETVQYTLTLQNEHGTTTGSGTYDEFETVLVSTIPEYNYLFTNWTEDGIVYSTDKNTTVTMTKDITLVANTEEMTLANSGIAFMV